jgi:hypothetical protein
MSSSAGNEMQAPPFSTLMPLQCTNKTIISFVLIRRTNYLFNEKLTTSTKFYRI